MVVVSHTHWDPEWYATYQQYRMRLVKLVDKLLGILERNRDYRHFMFDGQVSALEDYLEIRPENERKIRGHVKSGRLLIGPWWIMPEEFMISPESHIRNLLLGREAARRLGGDTMKIGYLCDMPGHVSQMPQILQGFGINAFAAHRGIPGYPNTGKDLFWWRGPDGSKVIVIHMTGSYGNALAVARSDDPAAALEKVLKQAAKTAATSCLLLMDGSDHREPSEETPRVIKLLNGQMAEQVLIHSTLPGFVACALKEKPNLKTHTGEMRCSRRSQIFCSGNFAARMDIKTRNRQAEVLLENWAEPFCAVASLMAQPYPTALMWRSWRYLLRNDFHDVIYGGHVDEVTRDAMHRYKQSMEMSHWLAQEALHAIVTRMDTKDSKTAIAIFNPNARPTSDVADFDFLDTEFDAPDKKRKVMALLDAHGTPVPFQLNRTERRRYHDGVKGIRDSNAAVLTDVHSLSILAEDLPPLGYRALSVEHVTRKELREMMPETDLKIHGRTCENQYLKLKINANGSLDVTHKPTGAVLKGLNHFEESGEIGDCYFHHKPRKDKVHTTLKTKARIKLTKKGPVEAEYTILIPFKVPADSTPQSRSKRLVICPITTHVTLKAGAKRVEVRTEIANRAKSHRIRAAFPTGIRSGFASADSAFDVIKRPVVPPKGLNWKVKPEGYHPQRHFVSLHSGRRGFTLISKGIPQYQVDPKGTGTVYLTLLRCVSNLLKLWLPGWTAGKWNWEKWETPDAQEIGTHSFEYAIYPHKGDWHAAESHQQALAFQTSIKAMQTDGHEGQLPREMSFLGIGPSELALSSVKQAEDGKGVIVRFYNISGKSVSGRVKFGRPFRSVSAVDLKEERVRTPRLRRESPREVALSVGPHKVVSLRFTPR